MFSFKLAPEANQGVGVAFTDRQGGLSTGDWCSLNLGRSESDPDCAKNLNLVRRALGIRSVVALHQVHGNQVYFPDFEAKTWTGDEWTKGGLPQKDAAVTTKPGLALMIRGADCLPVLFASGGEVVGGAHAGRVGLLEGVLTETVKAIKSLSDKPIRAWIGPHICGQCYEVPAQMADEVAKIRPEALATTSWGTPSLDLGLAAQTELENLGVKVHRVDPCTREPNFFSHRFDGAKTGRQVGIVWLQPAESSACSGVAGIAPGSLDA